jgi:uncharacterized metal-binding protein YceD (DUF177 family)
MADTLPPAPFERPKEVERLRAHKAITFDESPSEAEAEAIRTALGLRGLRKMRFTGELSPMGKRGWLVEGTLGASITQECVVTLEPVKTRIDFQVSLRFLPESMIEDDTPEDVLEDDVEPLGEVIDLGHVAVEALSLAMPDYPRAQTAEVLRVTAEPEGAAPIKDEETKAFAGLGALRDKMGKSDDGA